MLRSVLYDIQRGREDKFPPCCIAWYALLWGRLSDMSQYSKTNMWIWRQFIGDPYWELMKLGWKFNKLKGEVEWNRIPCPKCLIKGEPSKVE